MSILPHIHLIYLLIRGLQRGDAQFPLILAV
uniref:Uncharacterized protein n=1 Tax=Anguilla anguilla TaxID=7936 RepID=A0A0E9QMK7_ANGAN